MATQTAPIPVKTLSTPGTYTPSSDLGKSIMSLPVTTTSVTPDLVGINASEGNVIIGGQGGPLDAYLRNAESILGGTYGQAFQGIIGQSNETADIYNKMSTQQLNRQPLVQQTYANLADEISNTYSIQTGQTTRLGEQNIGTARASLASAGIEGSAQGAFKAPVQAAQNELMDNLNNLSNTYNINVNKLTLEMNSSLQDLQDKADMYKMQGKEKVSALYTDLIKMKVDYTSKVTEFATQQKAADDAYKRWQEEQAAEERRFQQEQAATDRRAAQARADANANRPAKPTRDDYNAYLNNLEGNLKGYQARGYKGELPSKEATKAYLRSAYAGSISAQEINGYVDTLYNRYYLS